MQLSGDGKWIMIRDKNGTTSSGNKNAKTISVRKDTKNSNLSLQNVLLRFILDGVLVSFGSGGGEVVRAAVSHSRGPEF